MLSAETEDPGGEAVLGGGVKQRGSSKKQIHFTEAEFEVGAMEVEICYRQLDVRLGSSGESVLANDTILQASAGMEPGESVRLPKVDYLYLGNMTATYLILRKSNIYGTGRGREKGSSLRGGKIKTLIREQ